MIKHVKFNIFESGADIICHQVNCQGVMGSGIAKQVRERYPWVYGTYRETCTSTGGGFILGKAQCVYVDETHIVVNLFAQENYGYDGKCYTDYTALEESLKCVKNRYPNKTIAIPYRIGCCRGGGDWNIVYKMIEEVFSDYDGDVLICEYNGG